MGEDRVGTQEAKRREKAEPDPRPFVVERGCWVPFAVHLGICAFWFAVAPGFWPVALSIPAVLVLGFTVKYLLWSLFLLSRVRLEWARSGVRCLVVHSDSELWRERITTRWLPRIGAQAVTFNWSEHSQRKGSLEARVLGHFCGDVNFNPAVIVFRGLRHPRVFRFYYAFRETRAGRPEYLERQEARMFESLGV